MTDDSLSTPPGLGLVRVVMFGEVGRWGPSALDQQAAVTIGFDDAGCLPQRDDAAFDLLLTTRERPPYPWVSATREALGRIERNISDCPVAASVFCRVMRIGGQLDAASAFELESLAYSTLLGGAEFRAWRARVPARLIGPDPIFPLRFEREGDHVTLVLSDPERLNATTPAMRDALCEALNAVLDDPTAPSVTVRGEGRCFSTGGDLSDFGSADDLAQAHIIRILRSPARLLGLLGDRSTALLHGACIGAGLEIGAAASRRIARKGAIFQLPELQMGLIPGAGGTVSLGRAIGRHRTGYLYFSGRRIGAATARDWDLVNQIVSP